MEGKLGREITFAMLPQSVAELGRSCPRTLWVLDEDRLVWGPTLSWWGVRDFGLRLLGGIIIITRQFGGGSSAGLTAGGSRDTGSELAAL